MANVAYTSRKGMKQLGTEVVATLAASAAQTLTDTSRLVGGSWSGVNATLVGTGPIEVTSTSTGGYATRTITGLTIGNTYSIYCTLTSTSGGNGTISVYGDNLILSDVQTTGLLQLTIIADATTLEIRLVNELVGVNDYSLVSVYDGILDYSNTNLGLQVVGSITAAPSATGAELLVFSGFSNANYIKQKNLNTGLNYENSVTKVFNHSGWVKVPSTTASGTIFAREYTAGSIFKLAIVAGALEFTLSDDFASFDTVSYTSGIQDATWHYVNCIARNVLIGTGSEAVILELWVDGSLVGSTTVSNAALLLSNNLARLTYGNNYIANAPLTGGSLAMWKSAPYAPLAAEINTIYKNERPMFKPYSVFRLYGSQYNIDLRYTNLTRSYGVLGSRDTSFGRNRSSTVSSDGQTWSVGTVPLNKETTQLPIYLHFLDSVVFGDMFTFDERGTFAEPYDITNVYLTDSDYSESRNAKSEFMSLSFSMVEK